MSTMAATTASITVCRPSKRLALNCTKTIFCSKTSSLPNSQPNKQSSKLQALPTSLAKNAAVAGTFLSTLAYSPLALAAKQIAESPQQDNRSLALLLPIVPAIGWVLFNILQPALNQLNRMRNDKGIILGLGLTGLAASNAFIASSAAAAEVVAEAIESDGSSNKGLLPFIVAAAVGLEVIILSTFQSKEEGSKH